MGKEHWVETTLGMIATHPQYGWTTKAGQSGKYKYFRTTDIDSPVNWANVPFCVVIPNNPKDYIIRRNDILVSRAGSVGLSIRFEEDHLDTLFASYLIRFLPVPPVDSKLIEYYLRTKEYWSFIGESQSGIAVPNVNATKLANLPFPLPPINEQKRIVETLDAILPKVNSAKARLEKIPIILKKFRQSVLAAACSGRLTEAWREGKDLPDWEEKLSEDLFSFVTSGSRGWAKYYSKSGALFLRIGNLDHFSINLDLKNKQYVNPPKGSEGTRTRVQTNDILISITADVGMIGLVPAKFEEAYINQHISLARPKKTVYPIYLAWYLTSTEGQYQFQEMQRGATKVGLGLDDIKNVKIPLPSYEEQKEIVRRIEKLFDLADSLEAKYKKAMERVDKIEQSVLAKAFRGELVEPDPNDLPAAELLKQILAEKEKLEERKKKTKHSKTVGNKTRKL